ncbi:MAG: T9SS type A sorting domain-containing protein [Paludibacter sp.]|nr:T9SS type A sorting domain-containing protein [Paludibacter sp.]
MKKIELIIIAFTLCSTQAFSTPLSLLRGYKKNIITLFVVIFILTIKIHAQEYQHLIIYGQSLSVGHQSWPPLSTTPVNNNFMIGSQVWTNYDNPVTNVLNPLIANPAKAVETQPKLRTSSMMCECPLVSAANHIQLKTAGQYKFIASSCGTGGQSIEQLSKEYSSPTDYANFTNAITYASSITSSIHCPAIFWMQGEDNYTKGSPTSTSGLTGGTCTSDKARYKMLMLSLKNNMQNDIQLKYNQTDKPVFITYQVGKSFSKGKELNIGMAQLEAANEYDDIICAGPVYYLPDRWGHLDANGYRWFGEILGKVYYKNQVLGEDFRPLQPKEISRTIDPKVVKVKFLVPYLPLVLDEKLISKQPDFGFEIYLNGTKVALASVVVNGDCIDLTSTIDLTGDVEVVYAGINTSGKGNLRDSDPYTSFTKYIDLDKKDGTGAYVYERSSGSLHPVSSEPVDGTGAPIYDQLYPLYNFSLAFYYKLKATDQIYTVPNLTKSAFVNVSGINVSPNTLSMNYGTTATLTPTVFPSNATNSSILWSSSNESVATVSNGVVTAIGGSAGASATITATSVDQGKTATCVVTSTSAPYVIRSVPSQYATIQAAITAATAGDIIDIAAGTYTEKVTCNKALTIQGAGMGTTIVQADVSKTIALASGGSVFTLDAAYNSDATITLKNMTIQNGYNSFSGSGIRFIHTGTGTVTLNLYDLKISDNRAKISGAGVVVSGKLILNVEKCDISSNTANANASSVAGAGIGINQTSYPVNVTIKNSTISNNTATSGNGGALYFGCAGSVSSISIENSTIYGNTTLASTRNGAGIYITAGASTASTITLKHCTVANNTTNAGTGGDGIYMNGASASSTTLVMNNSIVMNNSGSTSNVSQIHGLLTNGGITNSIFSVANGNTWFPSTGTNTHNKLDAVDADLAFAGSLSADATPVLSIGDNSIAKDFVLTNYLSPALMFDQRGVVRDNNPDAGAMEYILSSAIESVSEMQTVRLITNPVTHTLLLEGKDIHMLTIYTSMGQQIYKGIYQNSLDVSKLPTGFYIGNVISNNQKISIIRFIKK